MDVERMLTKCEAQRWRVEDLDWTQKPRSMSRDEEVAVVRYFKNMAGIERFAGALFDEQGRLVADPVLRKIFATFSASLLVASEGTSRTTFRATSSTRRISLERTA
jgi:hypothetical protein